jgi:hypothetical protein
VRPTDFPEKTRVLQKPPGMTDEECQPLAIHDTGEQLISRWEPTPEERRAIAAGAPIWLSVTGRGHPPVNLEVVSPFDEPVPAPPELPAKNDFDAITAAATRLADRLSREVEPRGWRYGLFLYRDERSPVVHISRDRERTAMAVASWLLDHLESKKTPAGRA